MSEIITLNDYKKNLDSGKYKSLAGARRGAGKIQGWDDDTREKAKRVAEHFFANHTVAPATKPAEAAAPKRGPGRPAAQVAKPAAPKPQKVAAPAVKQATPKAVAKPAIKATAPVKAPVKHKPTGVSAASQRAAQMAELTSVVGTISEALDAIKQCAPFVGGDGLREEALTVGRVLSAAVRGLEELVIKPVLPAVVSGISADAEQVKTGVRRRVVTVTPPTEPVVHASELNGATGERHVEDAPNPESASV